MFTTRSLYFICIFCISSVISEKVVCEFENSKCLTETAGLTFEQFISGGPGVESSDPLYAKVIEANHPTLKYKYVDAKLFGMKKCKVALVKISTKDLKYDYHLECPHVTLEAKYELNGEVGPQHVEGTGDAKVDFYDIQFLFHGDYIGKEDKNGKGHINLKNHELEVKVNGKVQFDFKNLFDGDKEKSDAAHKSVNENWEPVAKMYGKETMKPLMEKYISNVNTYLDVYPAEDVFSYQKISTKDLKYDYHLECPHVTLEAKYELNGEVGPQHVEGTGDAKVDFYDIQFLFHGDYISKEDKNGKGHINLKNHELEVKVNGKVQFDFKNLFDGDKEKSDAAHKSVNENWEPVAKMYGKETMNPLMEKYISNVNTYLDVYPAEDVFSYQK